METTIKAISTYEEENLDLDNEQILIKLMDKYSQEVMWLAYSYVKDMYIAEDLTQEVFIKCYENLDTFRGHSTIRTWLFRITINSCKDYLKSSYFKRMIPSIIKPNRIFVAKDTPEHMVQLKYQKKNLSKHLLSMPVKYREVIILYYFQELKIKEISNLLNTNENTIKTRLRKAKNLLVARYEKEGVED
jgi:RNA polymerase sigma-70 factor, ECF subfamily